MTDSGKQEAVWSLWWRRLFTITKLICSSSNTLNAPQSSSRGSWRSTHGAYKPPQKEFLPADLDVAFSTQWLSWTGQLPWTPPRAQQWHWLTIISGLGHFTWENQVKYLDSYLMNVLMPRSLYNVLSTTLTHSIKSSNDSQTRHSIFNIYMLLIITYATPIYVTRLYHIEKHCKA